MARLLRSYGVSKLRAPVVTDAATVFRPVLVALAQQQSVLQARLQRLPHSEIRPPVVVSAAVVSRPLKLQLAPSGKQARASHPHLFSPAVVSTPVVYAPVSVRLSYSGKQGRASHWKLRPPIVVSAAIVSPPLSAKLARTPRQPSASHWKLSPPAVVAAAIVFDPIRRVIARCRPPTQTHPKLNPPATLVAPVVFIAAPVKVALAAFRWRPGKSKLAPPVVISAATVSAPLRTKLAWQFPRPTAQSHYKLQPPTVTGPVVVAFIAAPIRLTLVAMRASVDLLRRGPKPKLRPPTVVSAAVVAPPLKSTLAPSGKQGRAPHPKLRAPVVISAPTVFRPVQTKLAWQTPTPARVSRSRLRPPAVVTPFLAAPIRVISTGVRTAFERIRRRLRPQPLKPGVVSPFVPPTASAYGGVFLSDVPLYEASLDTVALYEAALSESVIYMVGLDEALVFGLDDSASALYEVSLDDFPAS